MMVDARLASSSISIGVPGRYAIAGDGSDDRFGSRRTCGERDTGDDGLVRESLQDVAELVAQLPGTKRRFVIALADLRRAICCPLVAAASVEKYWYAASAALPSHE